MRLVACHRYVAKDRGDGAVFRGDRRFLAGEGTEFIKCHGLGNDFVVVDERDVGFMPPPEFTRWVCDRRIGVGGDQLLVLEPGRAPGATFRLRIYNVDGAEAPACFNATRCVAWLVMEESGREQVVVETMGGLLAARREGARRVSLKIGRPRWDWRAVPLAGPIEEVGASLENGPLRDPVAVNVGNPHLVYFVPDRDALDVAALADPIQKGPGLPEQANIGVAEIAGAATLRLVVYERPGILTHACGSGACAATLAARLRGLISADAVTVEMPGGTLRVEVGERDELTLTGDVALSFSGCIPSSDTRPR